MKIGIVGYGTGGKHFHAPFIDAADGIEIAGIVARSDEKQRAVRDDYPGVQIYSSLTEMIEAGEVDAVTITTPPETRRELVLEAISAGLHVVADKPFAPDTSTACELRDAAQQNNVMLGVYHNRRFDTDIQTFRKVMESGELGRIWRLHLRFDLDDPDTLEPGPQGGLLRDLGSHVVDQAVWLLGPVKSVYAIMDEVDRPEGRTNASFTLDLVHQSGAHSHISASKLNRLEAKELIAYGENGSYQSQATDVQAQAIFAGNRPIDNPNQWGIESDANLPIVTTAEGMRTQSSVAGRYQDYYSKFAHAVETGSALPVSADEAVHILAILDAAKVSAQENKVVMIDGDYLHTTSSLNT